MGRFIIEMPDGARQEGARYVVTPAPQAGTADKVLQGIGNLAAGAVRGAGSIGATVLTPLDLAARAVGVENSVIGRRDRRAMMDEALKNEFGADPESLMYGAGKIGAEVAGTLPVGGIIGGAVGKAVPALGTAIQTGGFSTGLPTAIGAAQKAADIGLRTLGGGISGAASSALVDPSDALAGGVIGAATPNAVRAVYNTGGLLGSVVSGGAAKQRAVKRLVEELGPQRAAQAVADIQTYYPKGAENIPMSAASILGVPEITRMEQASRLRSPAWQDFDLNQAKAVAQNVREATKEADQIGSLAGIRRDNWTNNWELAAGNIKPRVWTNRVTQLWDDVERAMQSAPASNPQVMGVLQAVRAEMDRLGPNFGPGNLQQLRANLSGRYNPMSPDAFKAAPRDLPAVKTLIQEMDDILNQATGGKWQKTIQGYAQDSEALHAAKAAEKVRGAFWDRDTGRVLGTAADAAGDVPTITEAGLGRALNAARLPDKSLALSAAAADKLDATLEAVRRQNEVRRLLRSGTAGGGSATASNAIALGQSQMSPLLGQLLSMGRRAATGRIDDEAARLFMNPDQLAREIASYIGPQPTSELKSLLTRPLPVLGSAVLP